mmetsp:Transcript_23605/g.34799  ORF Transcript_23605/g.34799 Transcript_23605/m.34799 type:complete len:109 (+) Transcript_23605:326-652(+)|eukprot:4132801-Ditylum_brightwellii.AAC.1
MVGPQLRVEGGVVLWVASRRDYFCTYASQLTIPASSLLPAAAHNFEMISSFGRNYFNFHIFTEIFFLLGASAPSSPAAKLLVMLPSCCDHYKCTSAQLYHVAVLSNKR